MRPEGELAVPSRLLVERPSNTLLELAVGVGTIPTVEAQVVQVDHEFKVFRDVILGPVLDAVLGLQIAEADLIDG